MIAPVLEFTRLVLPQKGVEKRQLVLLAQTEDENAATRLLPAGRRLM
jgi:hypothetical protein